MIHREWANEDGEVVRHLCGDNRCVNPIHLIKGSDIENAMDEVEVEEFSNSLFEKKLGDYSLSGMERGLKYKVLVLRMRLRFSERFRTLGDVKSYGREEYRKSVVKKMITDGTVVEESVISRLNELRMNREIDIIIIPGRTK